MTKVMRLVSCASLNDAGSQQVSISVRYEAELEGGKRVVVLDERGWSTSGDWQHVTLTEILETSRVVVGPDEPYGGETQEDAANNHWDYIQQILTKLGIHASPEELRHLPHDVEMSKELRAQLASM